MKKVIRLTESDLKRLVERVLHESTLLNEDEPEPVHSDHSWVAKFAFDEGKANMTPKTKKDVTNFLVKVLTPMVPTIQQFIDSKYKLPQIFNINVGTSHTGTPEANAQVARLRKQLFVNLIDEALKKLGLNAVRREQISNMEGTDYQPSRFDYSFFDPKVVKPDDKERFGIITINPIERRGNDSTELAISSKLVQRPDVIQRVKRDESWFDNVLDYIGLGDPDYVDVTTPNVDAIVSGIEMLETFSDLEQLNQEILNARQMDLGQYLSSKNLRPNVMSSICSHLKRVVASRPGKSIYQVDCAGSKIRIEGLKTI